MDPLKSMPPVLVMVTGNVPSSFWFKVSGIVVVDGVVVSGRCHDYGFHAQLDARRQVDVVVELYVGPEVDELDYGVFASYAVYASEALDYAHRVPVDVVVYQIVAVLKVLPFRYAVRRD